MSKLDKMIATLCPDGVEYKTISVTCYNKVVTKVANKIY